MSCKVSTCIDLILFRGGVVSAYIVPVFYVCGVRKKKEQNTYIIANLILGLFTNLQWPPILFFHERTVA